MNFNKQINMYKQTTLLINLLFHHIHLTDFMVKWNVPVLSRCAILRLNKH